MEAYSDSHSESSPLVGNFRIASGLPSWDPAAHLRPKCFLCPPSSSPGSWFLLLLQNLCVPGGSFRAFTSLFYVFLSLTGVFSVHHCLNCHEFWTPFQVVQKKRAASASFYFILVSYPGREGGEGRHPRGPARLSNIRPFSVRYTA